MTQCS